MADGNGSRRPDRLSRRKVLRKASAASLGSLGVAASNGVASAQEGDQSDVEIITADQQDEYIRIARRDKEFSLLSDHVRQEYGCVISWSDVSVFHRYEQGDRLFTVVNFPASPRGDGVNKDHKASVAVKLNDESVLGVAGSLEFMENGKLSRVEKLSVDDGSIRTETAEVSVNPPSVTVQNGDDIRPQFDLPSLPSECDICIELYQVACDGGCGANAAGMCLLAGFTTGPGGVICAGMGAVVCGYIARHGALPPQSQIVKR